MALATSQPHGKQSSTAEVETDLCYHCEKRSNSTTYCERWTIWSCQQCIQKSHRGYHKSCENPAVVTGKEEISHTTKYFSILFTTYSGTASTMILKLGDKIRMEDHWLGTYVFSSAGMMLVRETRSQINDLILSGLASAK